MTIKQALLSSGLPLSLAMMGCGSPGYQAQISNVGQGGTSYQIDRVPVAARPAPPPTQPAGDASERQNSVVQAENIWLASLKKADVESLERALEPDFILVGPDGNVTLKEDLMASVRDGLLVVQSGEINDLRVQEYGNAAVATGTLNIHATRDGNDIGGNYRFVDTWIWKANVWRKAAASFSIVAR